MKTTEEAETKAINRFLFEDEGQKLYLLNSDATDSCVKLYRRPDDVSLRTHCVSP